MADRSGQAVVAEPSPSCHSERIRVYADVPPSASAESIAVRHAEDGLLVMTNHAVCREWAGREGFVPPDSHPRYHRLREMLGGERLVDTALVKAALRDHEGLVCSHGAHFPERKIGTLWPVVGRPGERSLEIAYGCTHPPDTRARRNTEP